MDPFEKEKWAKLSERRKIEILRTLYEQVSKSSEIPEALLSEITEKIRLLSEGSNTTRLMSLHNNFIKTNTSGTLTALLVFLDRISSLSPKETDFLVSNTDRTTSLEPAIPLTLVLENIRSAFNVGTLLRTADCLHIAEIYFVGYTPNPEHKLVEKTALGAQKSIAWQHFNSIEAAVEKLKEKATTLYAFETCEDSKELYQTKFASPAALVVGNERFGLSQKALQLCDQIVSIPTRGVKNSLNVGHAFAISGYEILRQWEMS